MANSINVGAGFGIRAGARVIDMVYGLILGIVAGIFGGIFAVILHQMGAFGNDYLEQMQKLTVLSVVLSIIGGILYQTITEAFHGASLGKLICGLRVLDQDGNPCGLKGALIRNLGWLVDGLFFGAVGYQSMKKTPLQQRYGDVWGKTVVVKAADVPQGSNRSTGYFVLAFILGSAFHALFLVMGLITKLL